MELEVLHVQPAIRICDRRPFNSKYDFLSGQKKASLRIEHIDTLIRKGPE